MESSIRAVKSTGRFDDDDSPPLSPKVVVRIASETNSDVSVVASTLAERSRIGSNLVKKRKRPAVSAHTKRALAACTT